MAITLSWSAMPVPGEINFESKARSVFTETKSNGEALTLAVYNLEETAIAAATGIKYVWPTSTERAAESGMSTNDLGLQQDTRQIYRYTGSAWATWYLLDPQALGTTNNITFNSLALTAGLIVGTDLVVSAGKTDLKNSDSVNITTLSDFTTGYVLKLKPHAVDNNSLWFGRNNDVQLIQSTNYNATIGKDIALNPFGGNIGIGTDTPGNKVDITTGTTTSSEFHLGESEDQGGYLTSTLSHQLMISGGAERVADLWVARATSASMLLVQGGYFYFYSDENLTPGNSFVATKKMTLDPDGHLLLNTATVENWHSIFKAVQFGATSSIIYGATSSFFTRNAYYDGIWRRQTEDEVQLISFLDSGKIAFDVAPSGTADTEITWTNALTIYNDGGINMGALPTSVSGLSAGDLWNNSGVVNIV